MIVARVQPSLGPPAIRWVAIVVLVGAAFWLSTVLAAHGLGLGIALVAMATMAAVLVYGTSRAVSLKYLVPAVLVTLGLQVWPIVFTAGMSFTNYGPSKALTQASAAEQITTDSLRPVAGSIRYEMTLAVPSGQSRRSGPLVMLLVDPAERALLPADGRVTELTDGVERAPSGRISAVPGYDVLTVDERESRAGDVPRLSVLTGDRTGIRALNPYEAVDAVPTKRYSAATSTVTDTITGEQYRARDGRFVAVDGSGATLSPDWLEGVGLNNFAGLISDPPLRSAILAVLAWNLGFAALATVGAFLLGAFLALVLDAPGMAGRTAYRAALLIPWVLPVFTAALAWRALFRPGWFDTPAGARIVLLLAAWWIGFPVMLVVCSRALRRLRPEIADAVRLDGATAVQELTRVRIPFLLTSAGPLLVGAFAWYFNQFPLVYLITGGGPFDPGAADLGDGAGIGATDLLVTMAYRAAFSVPAPSYGFAATIYVVAMVLTALVVGFALLTQRPADEPDDRWARR